MSNSTSATNYTVTPGDTLWELASRFYGNGNLWTIIYDANKKVIGPDPNTLRVGEVLTIPVLPPTPEAYYTVEPGDTLTSIAERAYGDGNKWPQIYNANTTVIGPDPNKLQPGEVLYIPAG